MNEEALLEKRILDPETVQSFQTAILENYHASGRSFPWRTTRNPYHILVSEMMLQQTQTERVVPKYTRWLEVFPDARTLSQAYLQDVYKEWMGLGYNRRARYLQETCRIITETYNGAIPSDPEQLDALPGIGPYTARAISTFAFGLPNVFIETNIRSVYIFFFYPEVQEVTDKEILELIEQTQYLPDPRTWYYALMDYGAVLKKKTANPNRKSAHYQTQSRFEGSNRQARGAVLKYLGIHGDASVSVIADHSGIPAERLDIAVKGLVLEGFVAESDGIYRIPR